MGRQEQHAKGQLDKQGGVAANACGDALAKAHSSQLSSECVVSGTRSSHHALLGVIIYNRQLFVIQLYVQQQGAVVCAAAQVASSW